MRWPITQPADGAVVLALDGRIAEGEYDDFLAALGEAAARAPNGGLLALDCAKVAYIASRGLRALVQGLKAHRGTHRLVVVNPSKMVRDILEVSRTDTVIPVHDSLQAALAAL